MYPIISQAFCNWRMGSSPTNQNICRPSPFTILDTPIQVFSSDSLLIKENNFLEFDQTHVTSWTIKSFSILWKLKWNEIRCRIWHPIIVIRKFSSHECPLTKKSCSPPLSFLGIALCCSLTEGKRWLVITKHFQWKFLFVSISYRNITSKIWWTLELDSYR